MNKVQLIGRLTADPDYYKTGENAVAKYTLAVDRRFTKEDGTRETDFIRIVCFGAAADFVNKYFTKGMKVAVCGRIQTGSYMDKNGNKVYTTDVVSEEQEFCEKKRTDEAPAPEVDEDGFMNVPEGIDEDLPFVQPSDKKDKKK